MHGLGKGEQKRGRWLGGPLWPLMLDPTGILLGLETVEMRSAGGGSTAVPKVEGCPIGCPTPPF